MPGRPGHPEKTELLDEVLLRKVEEVRDLLEERDTEPISDGDDPVWVLDQVIKRLE